MLLLTRRINESFFIGDIEVKVLGVNGMQARIGINAPNDITILREELYYRENPEKKPEGWNEEQLIKQERIAHNKRLRGQL